MALDISRIRLSSIVINFSLYFSLVILINISASIVLSLLYKSLP